MVDQGHRQTPRWRGALGVGGELRGRLPWVFWALGVFGLTQWLMSQPLLDVVSYEFSFVMAGVLSVAGIHLGAWTVWMSRQGEAPAMGSAEWSRFWAVMRLYWKALWPMLLIGFLALDSAMAYAAVAHECTTFLGVAYFFMLPGVSTCLAVALGVVWALWIPRKIWPLVAGLATMALSALFGVYKFYTRPPVCVYDPFFGYFSGNLYDELLLLELPLIAARAFHLLGGLTLLFVAAAFYEPRKRRLRWQAGRTSRVLLGLAGALVVVWVGVYLARGRLGFSLQEEHLAQRLGGRVESPHFTIYYEDQAMDRGEARRMALDAEFRYHQLREYLGVAPEGKLKAYVFGSSLQKKRLMGAHQVEMAKPWRREVYITASSFPHSVLRHELAHVFASAFGDRFFGVAVRWVWLGGVLPWPAFSPGLIEGVAVAADWRGERLTPHQRVRAMMELGWDPPLKAVMGLSFFSSAAVRSYSVAGSFCRFLIARYGAGKFRRLFRSGGDFRGVYGQSLDALGARWKEFVKEVPLSEEQKELAKRSLNRRSVFSRVCVHKVASMRRRAAKLSAAEAADFYSEICRLDPFDSGHLYRKMVYESYAKKWDEAWTTARWIFANKATSKAVKALTYRWLGNVEWRRGHNREARRLFQNALSLPVSRGVRRDLLARLQALENPELEPTLRSVLLFGEYFAAHKLKAGVLRRPDWALGHYLKGSLAARRERYDEAAKALRKALSLELPHPLFVLEARQRLGRALYLAGDHGRALQEFSKLDEPRYPQAIRLMARDWMERCLWAMKNLERIKRELSVR